MSDCLIAFSLLSPGQKRPSQSMCTVLEYWCILYNLLPSLITAGCFFEVKNVIYMYTDAFEIKKRECETTEVVKMMTS